MESHPNPVIQHVAGGVVPWWLGGEWSLPSSLEVDSSLIALLEADWSLTASLEGVSDSAQLVPDSEPRCNAGGVGQAPCARDKINIP